MAHQRKERSDGGNRQAANRQHPGRANRRPRYPSLPYCPNQQRPLLLRTLPTRRYRRLSDHQRPSGHDLRRSSRHLLHRHSVRRTHTDQARLRLRSRYAGTPETTIPTDLALQRPATVQSKRPRALPQEKRSTNQRTLTYFHLPPFSIQRISGAEYAYEVSELI